MNWIRDNLEGVQKQGSGSYLFEYAVSESRSQLVLIQVTDEVVMVQSPFAEVTDINSEVAANLVSENSLLGLRKSAEHFYISNLLFLDDLDDREIRTSVTLVGEEADRLERTLSSTDLL